MVWLLLGLHHGTLTFEGAGIVIGLKWKAKCPRKDHGCLRGAMDVLEKAMGVLGSWLESHEMVP